MIKEAIWISIGILTFFFLFLILWDKWRLKRLRKKYNEDDDKSKQGERRSRGETPPPPQADPVDEGHDESRTDELLPTTVTYDAGEDSSSPRTFSRIQLQER